MLWDQVKWGHSNQNPYQCCCLDSPSVGSLSTSSVPPQLSFPQSVSQIISHCAPKQPSSFRFSLTSLLQTLSTSENGSGILALSLCALILGVLSPEKWTRTQALLFSSKILFYYSKVVWLINTWKNKLKLYIKFYIIKILN